MAMGALIGLAPVRSGRKGKSHLLNLIQFSTSKTPDNAFSAAAGEGGVYQDGQIFEITLDTAPAIIYS